MKLRHKPGDVFAKATCTAPMDAHGCCQVAVSTPPHGILSGVVHHSHLPCGTSLAAGQEVGELVLLSYTASGGARFAAERYEQELVNYLYTMRDPLPPSSDRHETWVPRWREAARDTCEIMIEGNLGKNELSAPSLNWTWTLARNSRWVFPIPVPEYLESMNANQFFCPSPLSVSNSTGHILPCAYSSAAPSPEGLIPRTYSGKLIRSGGGPKKIAHVRLHGFLFPPKLHYGVWKHMVGGRPSVNPGERNCWAEWLGRDLPAPAAVADIFAECKENFAKTCCDRCTPEQFERVNRHIAPLADAYTEQAVTIWEAPTTKKMFVANTGRNYVDIGIKTAIPQRVGAGTSARTLYATLVLRGWSYDWFGRSGECRLDLTPTTAFLADSAKSNFAMDGQPEEWEFSDVERA